MRLRIREAHPKNISEAQAIRLETFRLADKQRGRLVRTFQKETDFDVKSINASTNDSSTKHF